MTIARSPYFRARGDVDDAEHPAIGTFTAAARIDGAPCSSVFRAPGLGEDNAAVFGRLLGLDGAELERLATGRHHSVHRHCEERSDDAIQGR